MEFINFFAAFQAVLEVRFSQVPGLKKVKGLDYAMQDTAAKKPLDLSRPWESVLRPGRKVIMSMLFQQVKTTVSSCPGCLKENGAVEAGKDDKDTHTQWCVYPLVSAKAEAGHWKLTRDDSPNPACRMWYRRVIVVGSVKRQRVSVQVDDSPGREEEEEDEDEIRDFRRVQIVQQNQEIMTPKPSANSTSRTGHISADGHPSPPMTTRASMSFAQSRLTVTIPKEDRTMTNIFNDELYNPSFSASASRPPFSQPSSMATPLATNSFANRLQAANYRHLREKSSSTSSTLATHRGKPSFRDGSPLRAPNDTKLFKSDSLAQMDNIVFVENAQKHAWGNGRADLFVFPPNTEPQALSQEHLFTSGMAPLKLAPIAEQCNVLETTTDVTTAFEALSCPFCGFRPKKSRLSLLHLERHIKVHQMHAEQQVLSQQPLFGNGIPSATASLQLGLAPPPLPPPRFVPVEGPIY